MAGWGRGTGAGKWVGHVAGAGLEAEVAREKGIGGAGGDGPRLWAASRSRLGTAVTSHQGNGEFGLEGTWYTPDEPCPLVLLVWGPLHSSSPAGQVWFPSSSALSPSFPARGATWGSREALERMREEARCGLAG